MAIAFAFSSDAQQLTAKDYEHAEKFMSYNTDPFIDAVVVRPNWLPGDLFWYLSATTAKSEFILVDPVKKTRSAAFDHQKLAALLSAAGGKAYEANKLPFQTISFSEDGKSISFSADSKKWKYDLQANTIAPDESASSAATGNTARFGRGGGGGRGAGGGNEVLSPDGKRAVFIKDNNLWLRDITTDKQTQLTTDGIKDFGYATDNAGWKSSDRAIVRWSPDSKKLATF